ncbi:MAG: serine/threonine-protein kinase PknK [Syntrophus sp. (in: bacteria)]|nr:serine/threonine-protein kinase PknK [Syntrophus sp. (in: bacteria)]
MVIILSGYGIKKPIYRGANNDYYLAERKKDDRPVIIKFPVSSESKEKEIRRFTHEHDILSRLHLPGIPESYGLERYKGGYALILESLPGACLAEWDNMKGLHLRDALAIGSKMAGILSGLHTNHVIHRGIKPEAIFYAPESGDVWLSDFDGASFSAELAHQFPQPKMATGVLSYMSPEQTGRMNRAVDFRTDFYSLGVTLYEIATSSLPFTGSDPLEIVHSHLARQPLPPREINALIPEMMSAILMKLLAKSPEDRYQSAWGLKADFDECLRQWEAKGDIAYFPLGSQDVPDRLNLSQKLYGREQEQELLLKYVESLGDGAARMIMVAGYSGIGKTSLVQEIRKPLATRTGYYIRGKFDPLHGDIPYSGLVQAFQDLADQVLSESEGRLQEWKDRLLAALGGNIRAVIDVIPALERVTGPQPPLMELGADEAQNRFNYAFLEFMRVCCRPEHPVVIFLDDLQWVDRGTLKLIELIIGAGELHHLLLIGAYRKNEVGETHPLMRTIDAVVKNGGLIRYIDVPPLPHAAVADMIADMLHKERGEIKDLAELIAFKTGGNPFFVSHFLTTLHQEELLTFDAGARSWVWDIAKIKALAITDNVIDLLIHRFHHLSVETRFVLQTAACIGSRFDLKMLGLITGSSAAAIRRDLNPALEQDLLIPIKGARLRDARADEREEAEAEAYRFQHDRVQQAAYTLIPPHQRKALHVQIGRALLEHFDTVKRGEDIFDILIHLNFATELITSPQERLNLAHLNLLAGRKAKSAVAFEPALNYIRTGMALLPEDRWIACYELTLQLHLECLETLRLCGYMEEMEPIFTAVKTHARTPLEAVSAYQSRIKGFMAQDRLREALVTAREILNGLGVDMPDHATKSENRRVLMETMAGLAGKEIEYLVDLPEMTDPFQLAVMKILVTMISVIYIGAPDLFSHLLCKQVQGSIRYGNAPGSPFLYAAFGALLCRLGEDIESGYRFGGISLALAEKRYAMEHKGQAIHAVSGYINHWKRPLGETFDLALQGYQSALDAGDFEFASYNLYCYCKHAFLSGKPLPIVEKEMEGYNHLIRKLKQETSLRFLKTFHQTVLNLLGRSQDPCRFSDGEETLLLLYQQANNRLGLFYLYFCKLLLHYLFGNYEKAVHYADLAEREPANEYGSPLAVPQTGFYGSLARLALCREAAAGERERLLRKVAAGQKKMQTWAGHAPDNYLPKFHLVEAERSSILGDDDKAIEHYHRAIKMAQAQRFIHDEALANELAAGYWQRKDRQSFAESFLRRAHECYAEWGCYAKTAQLEREYEDLLGRRENSLPAAFPAPFASELDMATIMKASQAVSGEIDLEKLLGALMRFVMENTGAERGSLILCSEGDLSLAAQGEAMTDEVRILPSIPIEQAVDTSAAIVHYVARTREFVVLNDALRDGIFINDPYVASRRPRSLFCGPIIHKQRLVSILYLESRLIPGVFSPNRLEIIRMLTSQMAVSIDNARLYERLKKAEGKYRRIFENAVEGIYQTTVGGQFISVNPAMANILGYDSPEDLTAHVTDIGKQLYVSREEREQFLAVIGKQKTVSGFEVQFYRKDGSVIWASLHARLNEDHEGKAGNIEGIFSDITERKRATEALRESEENLRQENIRLRSNIRDRYRFGNIIGKSPAMQEIYEFILKAAATNANVIVYGETGTGKELVARAIHNLSERKNSNFIPVNCGAIPENLMESEFFGYKKGAFTGAHRDKKGYLDLADGGTLFLDELGELSLSMQVKLLRVLDGRGYTPVGGHEIRQATIRFIAATNRNLQERIQAGLIREDFFYRIHILPANLPPLRERKEDIPLLVEHFMKEYGPTDQLPPLTGKITEAIRRHDWPGNVRELQNVLNRYFTLKRFSLEMTPERRPEAKSISGGDMESHSNAIELYERSLIETSLRQNQWHREKTATDLGMSRRTFFRKLKKYDLDRGE